MFVDYYDSAAGQRIGPRRVLRELRAHKLDVEDVDDFFRTHGFRPEYDAQEVLAWLGY